MVYAWRKPTLTVNGKDYEEGDTVYLLLKSGEVITGKIKRIKFPIGPGATIEFFTPSDNRIVEITVDMIDDTI